MDSVMEKIMNAFDDKETTTDMNTENAIDITDMETQIENLMGKWQEADYSHKQLMEVSQSMENLSNKSVKLHGYDMTVGNVLQVMLDNYNENELTVSNLEALKKSEI